MLRAIKVIRVIEVSKATAIGHFLFMWISKSEIHNWLSWGCYVPAPIRVVNLTKRPEADIRLWALFCFSTKFRDISRLHRYQNQKGAKLCLFRNGAVAHVLSAKIHALWTNQFHAAQTVSYSNSMAAATAFYAKDAMPI